MLYKIAQVLLKIIFSILFKVQIYNKENYNNIKDRCIICSNHISMFDPAVLGAYSNRQIYFMAKKELFQNKLIGFFFRRLGAFPVDRDGFSFSAIKNALSLLNKDCALGIFPEGTRVDGYDIENVKPGIAMLAYKSNSPVLPVYIESEYKFRGKVNIYFGIPKNYFSDCEVKPNNELYTKVSREILNDIYSLKK